MFFGKGAYMSPHLPGKPSTLSCLIPPLLELLQTNLCTVLRMADGVRIFQGLRLCLAVWHSYRKTAVELQIGIFL